MPTITRSAACAKLLVLKMYAAIAENETADVGNVSVRLHGTDGKVFIMAGTVGESSYSATTTHSISHDAALAMVSAPKQKENTQNPATQGQRVFAVSISPLPRLACAYPHNLSDAEDVFQDTKFTAFRPCRNRMPR